MPRTERMLPELASIKKRRSALGMTQKQLAQAAQVSQSLVTKVERGALIPNYEIARKLFTVLDAADKNNERTAHEIMKKHVLVLNSNDRISKAVYVAKKKSISQFPVVEDGHLVGALTTNAMVAASKSASVAQCMLEPFPTVGLRTPVSSVKELLRHHPAVLVLNSSKIEGIITAEDLL